MRIFLNLSKILLSFSLLVILLFITFTGCKKEDLTGPEQTQASVIMPLKVGNEWNFTEAYYDSTEKVIINIDTQNKVIKDTVIQNETWAVMDFGYVKQLFTNRQDGLYFSLPNQFSPQLAFKYPVEKGYIYNYETGSLAIVSTDTSITVPAGKFSCIKYYMEVKGNGILSSYAYIFMSPQIGIIKSERYAKKKSGKFYKASEAVLKSYKLQ